MSFQTAVQFRGRWSGSLAWLSMASPKEASVTGQGFSSAAKSSRVADARTGSTSPAIDALDVISGIDAAKIIENFETAKFCLEKLP